MSSLSEIERLTKKEEWETEWGYRDKPPPHLTSLRNPFWGKKSKKNKKKSTKIDDSAEIRALNREFRAKNRAEDGRRRQLANAMIDTWNNCMDDTTLVKMPQSMDQDYKATEQKLFHMRKNTRDYSISELEQLQQDVNRFVRQRSQMHGAGVPLQALIKRWNEFEARLIEVGEVNMKHCVSDISFCEQTIDSLTEGWKRGQTTPEEVNRASQEVDTRLAYLYPHLKLREFFLQTCNTYERIDKIMDGMNPIPVHLLDEFKRLTKEFKAYMNAEKQNEKVDETQVTRNHAAFKELEQECLRVAGDNQTTTSTLLVQSKRFCDGDVWGEYTGAVNRSGLRHGEGRIEWEDGGVYEGQWRGDNREGKGSCWYPNGSVYRGEWSQGTCDGLGVIHFPNGNVFEGEMKDGKKEGRGTFRWADGEVEVGRYRDGQDHGSGVRWNKDRTRARLLKDGNVVREITLDEAKGISDHINPPVFP